MDIGQTPISNTRDWSGGTGWNPKSRERYVGANLGWFWTVNRIQTLPCPHEKESWNRPRMNYPTTSESPMPVPMTRSTTSQRQANRAPRPPKAPTTPPTRPRPPRHGAPLRTANSATAPKRTPLTVSSLYGPSLASSRTGQPRASTTAAACPCPKAQGLPDPSPLAPDFPLRDR